MADLFEKSEGTRADLKNLLGLALTKCQANIYLAQFMLWIFNTTDGNRPLKKSYEELARRPWGLCCSRNQAYGTVQVARRLRFITINTTWNGPGIQGPNEYAIDWAGIRVYLQLAPTTLQPARQADAYPTICDPPPTTCDPPPISCDPPPTTCDPYKEYTSSHLSTPSFTAAAAKSRYRTTATAAAGSLILQRTERREPALAGDQVLAWKTIEERLLKMGIYADLLATLLEELRGRGACPADASALADHFESKPGVWKVGALALALKRWSPGQPYDAASLWPAVPVVGKWRI